MSQVYSPDSNETIDIIEKLNKSITKNKDKVGPRIVRLNNKLHKNSEKFQELLHYMSENSIYEADSEENIKTLNDKQNMKHELEEQIYNLQNAIRKKQRESKTKSKTSSKGGKSKKKSKRTKKIENNCFLNQCVMA